MLAVDIQPEMLALIENTKASEGVDNIEGILGQIDDPNLPPDSIDAAIMVDAYHEFSHPFEMITVSTMPCAPGAEFSCWSIAAKMPLFPFAPCTR